MPTTLQRKRNYFLVAAILLLTTVILYSSSWSSPFILDDWTKIQENPDLRAPFNLSHFIYPYADNKMHFRNDPSRPLTFMVYWLCWHAGDGSPLAFHVASTLAHALCAILLALLTAHLLWLLFGQYSLTTGAAAGLLFLTSPLMAGTVAYAYGLSDLLAGVLLLAALLPILPPQPVDPVLGRSPPPSRARCVVSWLFFILALGAKQSAVVLPAYVVTVDYFTGHLGGRQRLKRVLAPLTIIALIYMTLRWAYFNGIGDLEAEDEMLSRAVYFSLQGTMILKYLLATFAPFGLSVDHRPLPEDFTAVGLILGWAMVGAVSLLAWKFRGRRLVRLLAMGWFIFLITLLPTSSFLPTVDLYVERRAYVADLGIFMALAGVLWWLSSHWRRSATALTLLILTAQTALAVQRLKIYASPENLWQEALTRDPQNPRALINLGVYYSAVERWDDSRQALEKLLAQQPENGAIYSKLAYIYQQPGYAGHDDAKAWSLLEQGLKLKPDNIFALYNAGVWLMSHQRFTEAEGYFARALSLSPHMVQAQMAAGQATLAQKKMAKAKEYFEEVLRLNPDSGPAGELLRQMGSHQ